MATETADNIKLKEAIVEVSKLSPKDKVRIHNKYYTTVNTRNHIFRKYFGTDASYISRVEFRDPIFHNDKMIFAGSVVATTELWIKKNMIAVGICLARAGLDGGEFASADEMQIAAHNGKAIDELNNNDASDTSEENKNHIPPIKENDLSSEVSLSDFTMISNAIDGSKHLGQLRSIYTKFKNEIDNNEQLQGVYKNHEEKINRNKPKDDGWDI
jgi:hypothetical protein